MKNLGSFSIEPPYSITGAQNTMNSDFSLINKEKTENVKISDFSTNELGQYILIDWFQVTIFYSEHLYKNSNDKEFINPLTLNRLSAMKIFKDFFNINESDVIHESRGINGYTDCYSYKAIEIYTCSYDFEHMGINIKLTGTGCRDFEKLGLSWNELFKTLFKYVFNVNRIDVAIDDYSNQFYTIPKLKKYVERGLVRSKFKADYEIRRLSLEDGSTIGEQIQFGSRASQLEITFYNKLLERTYNQFIIENNIKSWVRCELRFRGTRAYELLTKMNNGADLNMLAKGVLSNYINFLVKSPTDSNKARWRVVEWWNQFLEGFDKLSLTKRNPENDITKKKQWLYDQVAKTNLTVFASELDNFELDNQSSDYLKNFLLKGFNNFSDKDIEKINSYRIDHGMVPITKNQLHDYLYSLKDLLLLKNVDNIRVSETSNFNEIYFGSDSIYYVNLVIYKIIIIMFTIVF